MIVEKNQHKCQENVELLFYLVLFLKFDKLIPIIYIYIYIYEIRIKKNEILIYFIKFLKLKYIYILITNIYI